MASWAAERALFDAFGHMEAEHEGDPPTMGYFATELAALHHPVFPLLGKLPMIATAHRHGDPLAGSCRGQCGRDGHGVYDATLDQAKIDDWWTRWPQANIGIGLPAGVIVLDVDPRSGGLESLGELKVEWGALATATLTSASGRGDGGLHYYFRHDRKVLGKLGKGLDLKRSGGYVVAPPSLHPDTRQPYRWVSHVRTRALPAPHWLQHLLDGPDATLEAQRRENRATTHGATLPPDTGTWERQRDSIADWYSVQTHWADILEPAGWSIEAGDGDSDGSRWRHPNATAAWSATIKHHTLFVYSPNTVFPVTDPGAPQGVTPFRAYAILFHRGDASAAARHLKDVR